MKKTYISPATKVEIFETSDVITASLMTIIPDQTGGTANVTTVNVAEEIANAE